MDSTIGFEMNLIVVEAIRGRCASFTVLTATVSEIFGGQKTPYILVVQMCVCVCVRTCVHACMRSCVCVDLLLECASAVWDLYTTAQTVSLISSKASWTVQRYIITCKQLFHVHSAYISPGYTPV